MRTVSAKYLAKAAAVFVAVMGGRLTAEDPTAFQLIEQGNQYVSIEAKDRVVQVRSQKSVAGLTPTIWYIVYRDKDAAFDATEVKFGAGKKLDVNRPMRLFEKIGGGNKAMDRARLKVDSDQAIEIALKEKLLERLTIKATQLKLEMADDKGLGDETLPVWRVELWAAKLSNPNRDVNIGEVIVSAEDGRVLETDLKINRVD
jgi:hypothetical protein